MFPVKTFLFWELVNSVLVTTLVYFKTWKPNLKFAFNPVWILSIAFKYKWTFWLANSLYSSISYFLQHSKQQIKWWLDRLFNIFSLRVLLYGSAIILNQSSKFYQNNTFSLVIYPTLNPSFYQCWILVHIRIRTSSVW